MTVRAMPFEDYLDRLSTYIKSEEQRLGSLEELVRRIRRAKDSDRPVSRSTVTLWRDRGIKSEIKGHTLEQLAAYRKETVDQCRRWLELGDNTQAHASINLRLAMELAPIDDIIEAMEVGLRRIKEYHAESPAAANFFAQEWPECEIDKLAEKMRIEPARLRAIRNGALPQIHETLRIAESSSKSLEEIMRLYSEPETGALAPPKNPPDSRRKR